MQIRRRPAPASSRPRRHTPEAQRLFDNDLQGDGYVTNVSRLWAHLPAALDGLSDLMGEVTQAGSLTFGAAERAGDGGGLGAGRLLLQLAWGKKLAAAAGPDVAAAVIRGGDDGLDDAGQALARWARLVATDPNAVDADDVEALREAGFDDPQIFALTTYVALRLAFSTVNDASGARPDGELGASTPEPVRAAVSFGRPVDPEEA